MVPEAFKSCLQEKEEYFLSYISSTTTNFNYQNVQFLIKKKKSKKLNHILFLLEKNKFFLR